MFASFFNKKINKIVEETSVSENVFNGVKKLTNDNEPIAISEEIVLKVFESLKEKNCHGFDRIPL
jgi:hypothetical protein